MNSRSIQHMAVPKIWQSGRRDLQCSIVLNKTPTCVFPMKTSRNCWSSVTTGLKYGLWEVKIYTDFVYVYEFWRTSKTVEHYMYRLFPIKLQEFLWLMHNKWWESWGFLIYFFLHFLCAFLASNRDSN